MFNNPEMRRNLWLEFKGRRLIAMPLVLSAVFLVSYLLNSSALDSKISFVGIIIYAIFTFVWGTRQAAETIIREVNLGTWWQQRMSIIGAWQMVWGKLFGATAFIWYGNLFCFLFLLAANREKISLCQSLQYAAIMTAFGVLAHAVSMLASLYSMRYRHTFEHFEILFYQIVGAMVAIPMLCAELWHNKFGFKLGLSRYLDDSTIIWYGKNYDFTIFALVVLIFAIIWVMLGLYFLMRAEFLIDNSPIIWFLFAASSVFIINGIERPEVNFVNEYVFPVPLGKMLAFNVIMVLMYLMACGESRDAIRLHLLKYYIAEKKWKKFFSVLPRTTVTLPVVVFVVITLVTNVKPPFPGPKGIELMTVIPYCIIASFFFMLRDIAMIYLFSVKKGGKSSDTLTPILCVLGSYTLLPAFLISKKYDFLASFFLPWPQEDNLILTIVPAFIEAALMMGLLGREWFVRKKED